MSDGFAGARQPERRRPVTAAGGDEAEKLGGAGVDMPSEAAAAAAPAAVSGGGGVGESGEGGGAQPSGLAPGTGSRAVRNTILILAVRIVSRLLALITVVAIGNVLGDANFGQMQTAIVYSGLISVIADLGFSTLYIREGARRPDQISRYLDNMLSVRVPLIAAAVVILAGSLWVVGLHSLILATAALLVSSGYQLMLRNTLYALQRLNFEIVEIIPEALLLLGLVLVGAMRRMDASYFIWAYTLTYIAAAVYFAAVLIGTRVWKPRWRFETALLVPWLRSSLPLAVTYIFTTVYWKVDVPILQRFTNYEQVGWYTLAYKPFESLLFVPMTLRTVIFPVLSIYHHQAPDRLKIATEKFFKALLLVGLPISVGVILLADQYNDLLRLFPQSAASLRILGLAIVFLFLDNTFAAALLAMDRQKTFAYIAIAGLGINVVLNLVTIPLFEHLHPGSGYLAASWNVGVTELGLVVVGWWVLRRLGTGIPVVRLGWRIVLAAGVMGVALVGLHPRGRLHVVVATGLAGLIYLACLWLFRVADDDERDLVRRALGRRRRRP